MNGFAWREVAILVGGFGLIAIGAGMIWPSPTDREAAGLVFVGLGLLAMHAAR